MQAPYPLIPIPQISPDDWNDKRNFLHWDMAMIHNVYIRGVNSVWTYAPLVTAKDVHAFTGYALTLCECIHGHHHGEEEIVFPFLSKKLPMDHNRGQHERFVEGLKDLEEYFKGVSAGRKEFDADEVQKLVTAFGDELVQHLHDEIPTLAPEELHRFEKEEFDAMMAELENHIKGQPGMFTVFPFTLSNHDSMAAPHWPPIPGPLKWFVRNIAVWRNLSYWKFSAYDMAGRPNEYLPARN